MRNALLAGLGVVFVICAAFGQQDRPNPRESDVLARTHEGLIFPSADINVSSPVDGLIETTPVDRGDFVEIGQVVATLESSVERATRDLAKLQFEMKAALESSKARMDLAKRKVEKNRPLYEQGIVSIDEMDEFDTEYTVALNAFRQAQENLALSGAELKRAEAALELRTIRSPVKGVVVKRMLTSGELVSRSKESDIMQVFQLDPLYVEVSGPPALYDAVKVGMKAEVRPNETPGEMYVATVNVVDTFVEAKSGEVGVRLELPNPEYRIRSGLNCQVRFLPEQ